MLNPSFKAVLNAGLPIPFYPGDLAKGYGAVVTAAQSTNVFVGCGQAACSGDPNRFLKDLFASDFIKVANQYVTPQTVRYTVGPSQFLPNYPFFSNTISENEILAIVHGAARIGGAGYGHIYHIFLPRGIDTCFDRTAICFSPDDQDTFQFCAYHASAEFKDVVGNVLYSVHPFIGTDCHAPGPSPNGPAVDTLYSGLSHEFFETITDPDGATWLALAQVTAGQEIADLCTGPINAITLNGHAYSIQAEYSNAAHACVMQP